MEILNYLPVTEYLRSSGQPNINEFALIANEGIETVINLAMPDSDTAIANEGELVSSQGMSYVHIPVVWQEPQVEQFELFCALLEAHKDKGVWVHCALNWRVSSFIYLYRVKVLGVDKDAARELLESVWQPNDVWERFIEKVLES